MSPYKIEERGALIGIKSEKSFRGKTGWLGRYEDGVVAFGVHGNKGGLRAARRWARELKKILKTKAKITTLEIK